MTLWYYKEKRQKVPLSSKIVQRDFFDFLYADRMISLRGDYSRRGYYSWLFSAFMITSMWLPLFRSTFLRKSEICSPRRFFTNSL